MRTAIWSHPWDVVDEGPAAVAERLTEMGIAEVNLATTMHSVQTLNPHNPERKTFFADAAAYFQPEDDRYGAIRPDVDETMGDADWLARIADGFDDTPISLNAWVVPFHSSKQGRRHPDKTLESPFGDSLVWGLCPSNPDVREYGEALTADLAGRDVFDRIEMELADFQYGTGYGWHHQEFFTRLGDLGEFLFGVCFCDHCRERAADAGVDADRARTQARTGLEQLFEGDLSRDTDVGGWLAENREAAAYANARRETVSSLFETFADLTSPADFGYYLKMGGLGDDRMGVEHSWKHGLDLDAMSSPLDYATVLAYHSDPTVVRDDVATAQSLTDVPTHAGILAGHPIVETRDELRDQVTAAVDAGAEGLSFYGYGVVPERNLEWIEEVLETVD